MKLRVVRGFVTSSLVSAEPRPNLIFHKAKKARKPLEKYAQIKVAVPEILGQSLFGVYPVIEALRVRRRRFHAIYFKKSVRDRADANVAEILRTSRNIGIPVLDASQNQLDRITDFQLHNGICADASPLEFLDFEPRRLSVFLDRVLDPGNVGAIARTALFFGADGVAFAKTRGPKVLTPSMSKASCGALERIPIQLYRSFDAFYEKAKNSGAQIVATCDSTRAEQLGRTVTDVNCWLPAQNVAIVLGDEGAGIREDVIARSDVVVSIPSFAPPSELSTVTSLNVSVVAALILHHTVTKWSQEG